MSRHGWKACRRALTRLLPPILLLATRPANADDVERWRPLIEQASTRFGLPSSWIERVMQAESRGLTLLNGRPIRSRAGAMGLMQLMPATWAEMRARLALGSNPDDPHDNILAATLFLRLMYDRFGYPGLFGAYNMGPGAYAAWLAGNHTLPGETIAYLETVTGTTQPASQARQPPQTLFLVRRTQTVDQSPPSLREQQASLFAVRNVGP